MLKMIDVHRQNGAQSILHHHLRPILPRTDYQQDKLPSLKIQLSEDSFFSFYM